jgi:hypothetical protein
LDVKPAGLVPDKTMKKLKAKLTKAEFDALPEALREYYTVNEAGEYILDAEGVEDVTGLKSALEKEKTRAKELKEQFEKFKDIDPDKAREALSKLEELEQTKLRKAGEFDKLKQQLVEQHNTELAKKGEREKQLLTSIESFLIDAEATAAIAAAKGVPALLLPHVKSSTRVVEKDGKFVVEILDATGNPRIGDSQGNPFTIKQLVEEMQNSDVYGRAFEASGKGGAGTTPQTKTNNTSGGRRVSLSDVDTLEASIEEIASGKAEIVD